MPAPISENNSSLHVDESRSLKLKSLLGRGVGHLFLHLLTGLSSLSVSDASVGSCIAVVMERIWNGVGFLLYLLLCCGDLWHLFDLEGLPLLLDLLLSQLEDLLPSLDLLGFLQLCLLCPSSLYLLFLS